jgi:hypothetical protein
LNELNGSVSKRHQHGQRENGKNHKSKLDGALDDFGNLGVDYLSFIFLIRHL